jgi:hypothetical protein
MGREGTRGAGLGVADPFALVPYGDEVLKAADGGPMSCKEIADPVYALGFQHRWTPKYPHQLVRPVNALASPSQHSKKFERAGPRVLRLRRAYHRVSPRR